MDVVAEKAGQKQVEQVAGCRFEGEETQKKIRDGSSSSLALLLHEAGTMNGGRGRPLNAGAAKTRRNPADGGSGTGSSYVRGGRRQEAGTAPEDVGWEVCLRLLGVACVG